MFFSAFGFTNDFGILLCEKKTHFVECGQMLDNPQIDDVDDRP